jgi:hypothetical protein
MLKPKIVLTGACSCNDDPSATTVSVSIEPSAVHIGENVTLTCRVASPSSGVATGLKWLKSSAPNDYKEETIADDEQLTSLYSELGGGRYEVVVVPVYEVTYYLLHIYRTYVIYGNNAFLSRIAKPF